ncbi:MAG: hypothetical protein KDC27_07665 [Acidobacteria bacterium]|nr:hypothetical protein [Acidobacteriota bacterium]
MQAEAARISHLAASAAVPLEEEAAVPTADVELWREIAQASRALDAWMWQARAEPGPLTLTETAIVATAAPLTTEIRLESATLAGDMIEPPTEWDAAEVSRRMQYVARASASVAKALEPLAICGSDAMEDSTTSAQLR